MITSPLPIIIAIGLASVVSANIRETSEERLYKYLFSSYSKFARPIFDPLEVINVSMTLEMLQIVMLDAKEETMKASIWPTRTWFDRYLTWNPADFENITILRVPPSRAWNPDIVLMNNVDGNFEQTYGCNMLIHSDGTVKWMPPSIVKSSCRMNVQYFPYDTQRCPLKFVSVTYDESQLQIKCQDHVFFDPKAYSPSAEWHVVSAPCHCQQSAMPGSSQKYTAMICEFELRRLSLYYTTNFVTPIVILTFLSLLCFCLPSETNEKIPLCTSILLSVTMLLLIVVKNFVPTTSFAVPLICQYLLFSMIMVSMSIISTVFVLNVHHRPPLSSLMPDWAHAFFLQTLARWLGLGYFRHTDQGSGSKAAAALHDSLKRAVSSLVITNNLISYESGGEELQGLLGQSHCETTASTVIGRFGLSAEDVRCGTAAVHFISSRYVKSDIRKRVKDEWYMMAKVLDRVLLLLYSLVILSVSLLIFFQSPNLRNDVFHHFVNLLS